MRAADNTPANATDPTVSYTHLAKAVKIPIIGMGGIITAEDAVEFLLAGATALQLGTANYADPRAAERLAKSLESWCKSHSVEKVSSLTGALEIPRA